MSRWIKDDPAGGDESITSSGEAQQS